MACLGLHFGDGNDSFRLPGTRMVRTPKRTWLFVEWTASLGAIKDVNPVPLFLLDQGGG